MRSAHTDQLWRRWCTDATMDDWAELCDALSIDYRSGDRNSRELRKLVNAANPTDQRLEQCFARLKGWEVQIGAEEAYRLIAAVGFRFVEVHPACDKLGLADGRTLYMWEGSEEYDRCWAIEANSEEPYSGHLDD